MYDFKKSVLFTILLFVGCFLSANALAESGKEIKARMQARLPEIVRLLAAGTIGEGKDGLLYFMSGASGNQVFVQEENDDRKKVYGAIARQQGTTPALVGERRALQIYDQADPGTWLQDANGKWYKK
ncbi:MAG: YdbL family protein [Proteobacteria bacterium]|nr:YdbL family protein [Pseudomonadota bacterium]MBU1738186.1 YdbL family protein [Pseudomonadota bacterium]